MSIKYGEMERQFLETLKADTGRSLDDWMAAIAAEKLTHRNDIIDWLRRQGFMFSKASWLERIHNNGGRPIYTGAPNAPRPAPRRHSQQAPRPSPAQPLSPMPAPPPQQTPTPPATAPVIRLVPKAAATPTAPPPAPPPQQTTSAAAPVAASDPAAIEALIARGKAYRPLANFVLAEIRKTVADTIVEARDGYLLFAARGRAYGLLAITAKELRLALSLTGDAPSGVPFETAKLAALRGAPAMTHMLALTDARQVTPGLLAAIASAGAAN